jgi:hypothetical protein
MRGHDRITSWRSLKQTEGTPGDALIEGHSCLRRQSERYGPRDLALKLTTYELTAEDILRLNRLVKGYPEINVPASLSGFLTAGEEHLESLRSRFPEVEILFTQYATISRWR